MLSEFIHARHSYPAVPLARQQVHQRSVHSGPLVLGANPLKNRTPAVDRRPTCLTHFVLLPDFTQAPPLLKGSDCNFTRSGLSTFSLYGHPCGLPSVLSIARGAKPLAVKWISPILVDGMHCIPAAHRRVLVGFFSCFISTKRHSFTSHFFEF